MAEIIRGGIDSVDKGQYDAARALGMNGAKLMRRVILPQAMRVVLPPTGNQVISMLKGTSLVSVLAISDCCTRPRSSTPTTTRPSRCSSWPASGTCS